MTDECRKNIREHLDEVGVDCPTPHLARRPGWAENTGHRAGEIRQAVEELSRTCPIYLQEEARRRHSGLMPTKGEFRVCPT